MTTTGLESPAMVGLGGASDRRADARRNCQLVVDAALEVFSEQGLDARMEDVARRAGLGKATVYRNFPTREDLLAAVTLHGLRWVANRATAALAEPDLGRAATSLLHDVFLRLRSDRLLAGTLLATDVPGAAEARARNMDLIRQVLEAAAGSGVLREDLTVMDLEVVMGGSARALIRLDRNDIATWERAFEMVLLAFGPRR